MNSELLDFTRRALAQGLPREAIAAALRQAGWAAAEVDAALRAYAAVDFPVPVPRPKPSLSAREVFVYLVMFTSLYVSAYHLGSLLFEFVNRALPDALDRAQYHYHFFDGMRLDVSALLISFPLFLVTLRATRQAIARDETLRTSWPRRWLTYLTMFIAVTSLAGDFGTLIYNALGGELSLRLMLKVLIIMGIAGGLFGYFLHDMRRDETERAAP